MSAAKVQPARQETVLLTREAVEAILVGHMGWETEDADIFWRMARRETSAPGSVAQLLERSYRRAFGQNQ